MTHQFERYRQRYFGSIIRLWRMQFRGGYSIRDQTNGEGSPPTTNKYARRGDIAFIGGGAILVIGLWIVGGVGLFRFLSYLAAKTIDGETNTVSGSGEAVTPCGRRETDTGATFGVAK